MLNLVTLLTTKHPAAVEGRGGERSFWQERGGEYVDKFFAGVGRHAPSGSVECFLLTDTPEVAPVGVTPLALPPGAGSGWWAKLAIFKPGLLPVGRNTLYCDLDNVICGPLAPLLAVVPPAWPRAALCLCDDVAEPGLPNGSLMLGDVNRWGRIWGQWMADAAGIVARYQTWPHAADQAFIADEVHKMTGWPAPLLQAQLPPGYLANAKAHLETGADLSAASILVGGDAPKPHQSPHRFYAKHWTL